MIFKKLLAGLLLISLALMPIAYASQYDMEISTSDANTGVTFRAAVNAALQALVSLSSGSSEPATTYAYQLWADTTTGLLKIRNSANNGWVTIWTLSDPTATTSAEGIVELATDAETLAGTDTSRTVTPSNISALLQAMPYAINENSAVIVSSASPNVGGASGNFITITHASGTTNITSLGTAPAGAARTTSFSVVSGTLALVHNASSLILPTSANITVSNGDVAMWRSLGAGNWKATNYMKANGDPLAAGGTVKVSSNDSTPGYLNGKLVVGSAITLTENGDGGNETLSVAVTSGAISTAHLKTTTGELTAAANPGSNQILPGGEYGFYPQFRSTADSNSVNLEAYLVAKVLGLSDTSITNIFLNAGDGTGNLFAKQRYVTASGTEYWVFILYDKINNKIISAWAAPDHPSYGNGNNADKVPHPFSDYFKKPLPAEYEIILLDMESIHKLRSESTVQTSLLEILINGKYKIDMTNEKEFIPRDMDGKRILTQKHNSYVVRGIK